MEHPSQSPSSSSLSQVVPHGALFLVLGYLQLPDLLCFQRVCRSIRVAVEGDGLLWRRIAVKPPLSGKLTDEALLRMASRAEGKVRSLGLFDCPGITDDGLMRVVTHNPGITELYVPGCTNLTVDGVVRAVKWLTENKGTLERLRLRGLCNIRKVHLDILNSLVSKQNQEQVPQQSFYGDWHSLPLDSDDGRPIDVEICPKCTNIRLVFDCTRENCRTMKERWSECRGCFFCIARCEDCGGCIDDYLGEETVCSHLLCLECWLRLPKCNLCNRPYCYGHEKGSSASNSAGFVCEHCNEESEAIPNDVN